MVEGREFGTKLTKKVNVPSHEPNKIRRFVLLTPEELGKKKDPTYLFRAASNCTVECR
jgi:hypothetical protein